MKTFPSNEEVSTQLLVLFLMLMIIYNTYDGFYAVVCFCFVLFYLLPINSGAVSI